MPVAVVTGASGGIGRAKASELRTGVCVELAGFVPGGQVTLSAVSHVPCDQPHRGEVFGSLRHPAAASVAWPGDLEVAGYAESECLARFVPAIGAPYESSVLDFTALGPTEEGWEDGDRAIVCIAYGTDGLPLTGTVLGSAR
jgi:hypothetical protein